MSAPRERFDFDVLFDADYRHFYEPMVPDAQTAAEAELLRALLGLQPGMAVLDVACGYGRMTNALARHELRMTGLDRSAPLLSSARRDARDLGLTVELVQADMRALPWRARFDAAFSWFTSFGYFDDATLRGILGQMHQALKPGGRVLVECLNRDAMLLEFQDSFVAECGDDVMVDRIRFDALTGRSHHERTIVRNGQTRRAHFFVRHFTFPELRDWLERAGFRDVKGYGSDGEDFSVESERMIAVATE